MNLIIEVIDGVAYAVAEADCGYEDNRCDECSLGVDKQCRTQCYKHSLESYYRRLTQTEREELIKAIGRGIE